MGGGRRAAERAAAAAQVFVDHPAAPVLADADAHHLARVLRLRRDETVVAADGRGGWTLCRYVPEGPALEPLGATEFEPAPEPLLTVALAPVKGERSEWAVQKLTEIGIDRLVPLVAERSVVRWDDQRSVRALERWSRVAREAAAQCRRVWLPVVAPPVALGDLAGDGLVLAEGGGPPPTAAAVTVAIGPEGGWSPTELAGRPTVGLGPHVLRAETAAVAAGVLLVALRTGTVAPDGGKGAQGSRRDEDGDG